MEIKHAVYGVVGFAVLVLIFALTPFTIVDTTERAVVLNFGVIKRVLEPGIHWVTPVVESVEKFDVATKKSEVSATSASKDLQTVTSKVAVNYNIQALKVGEIWTQFKGQQDVVVIEPSIQEAIKASTAKYTAEELITKREQVKNDIFLSLKDGLASSYIEVTDVSIVDFDFSPEFNKSIEAKVKAEQDALTSKNLLEQKKYEAQQIVVTAEANAKAIQIQAQAINSQGGEDYVNMKAVEKWDGKGCTSNCFGAGTQMPVPFLNVK